MDSFKGDYMKYTSTTPEMVWSKKYECGDTEEFIQKIKQQHPNVQLRKADNYVLDWTKPGYVRGEYIILFNLTDDDLNIIRKVLEDGS